MLKTLLNILIPAHCASNRQAEPGITLGVLAGNPFVRVALSDNEALRHSLVSGAPAPGVSALLEDILNQRTRQGLGWVYLDPDQDYGLRDRLYSNAAAAKREDEFLVIDLASPAHSYSIDLLEGSPAEVAMELAEVLPSDAAEPGLEFYKQTARAAMELILEAFVVSGRKYTLTDLFAVLMDKNATEALIQAMPAGSDIAQRLTNFNRELMADDRARYLKLLPVASRLAQLNTLDRANVLNVAKARVSLKDVLRHNKLCVITLPAGEELPVAGRVLLAKLMHAVQARAELPARLGSQVTTICLPNSQAYLTSAISALFWHARAYGACLLATWFDWNTNKAAPPYLAGNTWTKIEFESQPEVEEQQFKVVIGDTESRCKMSAITPVPQLHWQPTEVPASVDYRYPLDLHRFTKGLPLNE